MFRSEHNGSREVGNMPRNIPDAIFPVSGRHMHNGVEENKSSPLPLPPLHIPTRLFCETGAYRQKLRRRAKRWVVARDQIRGERAKRKKR